MTYPVDTATCTSLASDARCVLIHITVTIRIVMMVVILIHHHIVLVASTAGSDIMMSIARAYRAAGVWLAIDQGNA